MAEVVVWKDQFWELRRDVSSRTLLLLTPAGTGTARLRRAAAALQASPVDGIVRVVEVVERGGRAGFKLHDPGGETLAERVRNGPIEPVGAAAILSQVGSAIGGLHAHGLLHRLLRPELILMSPTGPMVIPGESLKPAEDVAVTRLGMYVPLPPPYAAPELFREGEASRESDAWAIGIIMFVTLIGRSPMETSDPFEFEALIRHGLPDLPELFPAPLREAYLGLTRAAPAERWTVARAVDAFRSVRGEAVLLPPGDNVRLRVGATILEHRLPCVVGRSDPSIGHRPDIDLGPFDPEMTVSRRHARLWPDGDDVKLEDLGSRNGTSVDHQPSRVAVIRSGAVIMFGSVEAEVLG